MVVFGTGAYQSMLTLFGLIAKVSADQDLGYGLAAPGALGLLYGIPAIGIVLGGTLAGVLSTRVGPAVALAGGVAIGAVGTIGMFLGDSVLPLAVICSFLLSLTAGTLVTSGFNMAATLAPPERQGVLSSMVMVMVATGAVILKFVGSAVLKSTHTVADGETVNSALGVHSYIAMATGAFIAAAVVVVILLRTHRRTGGGEDRISGLRAGGDDYVTKPFNLEELVLRIRAILRRVSGRQSDGRLVVGDLELDPDSHQVTRDGQPVRLSPTEFSLLRVLMENAGQVLSKSQLLELVRQYDFGGDDSIVASYISYLRRKVDVGEPELIHTVRGTGYVLRRPPR
ncbi:MFS transporter [Streptomyces violaceusniger]|uniref:MFS transporter n=1 Tax=Streptomyces violaceusniger TaxID=68280 RepID=UPI003CD0796C